MTTFWPAASWPGKTVPLWIILWLILPVAVGTALGSTVGDGGFIVSLISHSPQILSNYIADILNETAKTGKNIDELNQGILIPIQKPGKKQGPCGGP